MIGNYPLFGDDTGPNLWAFDESSLTDSGAAQMERLFTAGAPISGIQQVIANVIVSGNNGGAPVNLEPVLEMRVSRNGGRTWSPHGRALAGARRANMAARHGLAAAGCSAPPGFIAEFRLLRSARCASIWCASTRTWPVVAFKLPTLPPTQPEWGQFQIWWQQVVEAIEAQEALQDTTQADLAAQLAQILAAQASADAAAASATATARESARISSYPNPGSVITAADVGTDVTITIAGHTRVYPVQGTIDVPDVAITGGRSPARRSPRAITSITTTPP
jgi:hypothetical protein